MFETRKKLAEHYLSLGLNNHPYVLEMIEKKGDNPQTLEIEEATPEVKKLITKKEAAALAKAEAEALANGEVL